MVAGKVKSAMGLPKPNKPPAHSKPTKPASPSQPQPAFSFGVYFPRASAQVQPRPPDVPELLRLVEELRESESRLKTELLEQKLIKESAAIVPVLENVISNKDMEIERGRRKIVCLEAENERLRNENEFLHTELSRQNQKYEEKFRSMQAELSEIKRIVAEENDDASSSSSSSSSKYILTGNKSLRKCASTQSSIVAAFPDGGKSGSASFKIEAKTEEIAESLDGLVGMKSRVPRVPTPPPRPSAALLSSMVSSSSSSSSSSSLPDSDYGALAPYSKIPPPPPPPPPPVKDFPAKSTVPPPPPPPPRKGYNPAPAKVKRVPEVVEFYHSLMRRESNCRRDSGGGAAEPTGATAKDMIGEIENRSAHLLAIKTDVETQGDFIRFLIKEVEGVAFTDIEDVVPFVKWLDDELSYLIDERAVLKHFDWPEKKADALREAAFGYCDLKKLESEASSFRDDPRQPCGHALKKMQSLFEKLEHGVYKLSRTRESATERYKSYHIPVNWMLDSGYVSQIKLASVKLAMKYMKRVLAELEMVGGGPEEEELIVQGVKFAFRVHQFAGGFDVETMRTFQEVRDKARSCSNAQCHNQHQQRSMCRSSANNL